ncbi:MAG: YigZ family protein [Idiomarina sp.]|nr:YigZ family protein [Idiomarina sp.]
MSNFFQVPTARVEQEIEVKKSRFIANAGVVTDRTAAMLWLSEIQQRYPDARHHCWAYLLGDNEATSSAAMSDDGEPSGTAGKPILNVLQHKRIGNIMVVVSRYFGGVKLGAGGLVRAYSQATENVLQSLPLVTPIMQSRWQVQLDFSLEQPLRHVLQEAAVEEITYAEQVTMILLIPCNSVAKLREFCERHQLLMQEI